MEFIFQGSKEEDGGEKLTATCYKFILVIIYNNRKLM